MKTNCLPMAFTLLLLLEKTLCAQPQPGTLLWSYPVTATITTSPAVAPDGTIYIGTGLGLYAITNAGSNSWTFSANVKGSPAIGLDGTVYFGDYGGTFYALNSDGSQKWSLPPQGLIWSTPAIGSDNTIYFVSHGYLVALSPEGAKRWQYQVSSTPAQGIAPIIGPDGTVYVSGAGLYALNPDGTRKWFLAFGTGPSPAFGADGTIYVTDGSLYAFSPAGSNLWSTAFQDFSGGIPAIGKNGTIYVESAVYSSSGLHAFTPSGQLLWRAGPSPDGYGYPSTCPAIDASGMLYFSSSNSVFAITPQGNIQWVFGARVFGLPPPPTISSPAIGSDGTIYAAFQNTLYALAGTNKLADSPWPMYHQNLRHTGKIEKPSLQQPKKRTDAGFQLQIMNQLGSTNLIQTSLDLVAWSPLTNVIITNVPMDFIDWDASNFDRRFYRAVQQ